MVFKSHRSAKEKHLNDLRCKSADSGVSIALNKTYSRHSKPSSLSEIEDLEEEHLDFEPEFEDDFEDTYENKSPPPSMIYSDQTVKDYKLECRILDDISDVSSIGHRRDMLPVSQSDAPDGRQLEYLPLPIFYTPTVSVRTTIDSSSDEGSDSEAERNMYGDVQNESLRDQYNQESGNSDNDDNLSTYNFTREEEDKLLDSEEESQDDDSLLIRTDLIETCHIGNARITLPRFVSNSPNKIQTNDLKRTKSTAKLKTFEGTKKKKKWDLAFKPEYPLTRIFLEDIGYISEPTENTLISDDSNNISKPPFGKLIVICSKDKISCEEPQKDTQRQFISVSQSGEGNFKLPLPPPKRPPTRPKRTVCNSVVSGSNLQIKFSNKQDEFIPKTHTFTISNSDKTITDNTEDGFSSIADKDDSISIIASTIDGDNEDVPKSKLFSVEKATLTTGEHLYPLEHFSNVEDRVKEWIKHVHSPNDMPTSYSGISDVPLDSQVNANILHPLPTTNNPRINFKEVPNLFIGLCYHYYFNGRCTKRSYCKLLHYINIDKLTHKFTTANPTDLHKAFQFSIRFENLFKEIYPVFIKAFGVLKMQKELITCIKIFLKMEGLDLTEAIKLVVDALEESGLSFIKAIRGISYAYGFLEYPILTDILLDNIATKYNISENWEIIKEISSVRGHIPPSAANKILSRATSVYPLNRELCLDIYTTIVRNNNTDLTQIEEKVLLPYRTLVGFRDDTIDVGKSTSTVPLLPNSQELSAHIDKNLIREREWFERQVEGTTVRTTTMCHKEPELFHHPSRSNNCGMQSLENCSLSSSDSDERYFMPSRPNNSFLKKDQPLLNATINNHYGRKEFTPAATPSFSDSLYNSSDNNDPNVALHFQPPSDITEYVPENVRRTELQNEQDNNEINLTPSRPIFGKPRYRTDFDFERSLHNLLPDILEHVNINERDVLKLNSVIKAQNGSEFFKLLKYYASPPTLQNFITMTIVHLKSSGENIYNTLSSLLKALEVVKPDYCKDKQIKAIIEVVVMNLLFDLEKKGKWEQAKNFLHLFCDWDSLVSSKIFSQRRVTHMGRYLFLAKVFIKAKDFHFAYEILQHSNLNFFQSPKAWPYFCNYQVDLESRNALLKEFFEHGHHHYIIGVSDIYRRVYKYGPIYKYDAHIHFNPMLISLMNDQQLSLLKYFLADIEIYYKHMECDVLRAFTIMLWDHLSQENACKLYELCCERKIYTHFTGTETSITVRTNMLDTELQLIFSYYFDAILESGKLPNGNVAIQIKLMDKKTFYPKMLQKCVRSIKEINDKIKTILEVFNINITETANQSTVIEISLNEIIKWKQCKQKWFSIYH